MQALPQPTITAARQLLADGWTPAIEPGRVHAPIGAQPTAAHWVTDWCWQAMWLMVLNAQEER